MVKEEGTLPNQEIWLNHSVETDVSAGYIVLPSEDANAVTLKVQTESTF